MNNIIHYSSFQRLWLMEGLSVLYEKEYIISCDFGLFHAQMKTKKATIEYKLMYLLNLFQIYAVLIRVRGICLQLFEYSTGQ